VDAAVGGALEVDVDLDVSARQVERVDPAGAAGSRPGDDHAGLVAGGGDRLGGDGVGGEGGELAPGGDAVAGHEAVAEVPVDAGQERELVGGLHLRDAVVAELAGRALRRQGRDDAGFDVGTGRAGVG